NQKSSHPERIRLTPPASHYSGGPGERVLRILAEGRVNGRVSVITCDVDVTEGILPVDLRVAQSPAQTGPRQEDSCHPKFALPAVTTLTRSGGCSTPLTESSMSPHPSHRRWRNGCGNYWTAATRSSCSPATAPTGWPSSASARRSGAPAWRATWRS